MNQKPLLIALDLEGVLVPEVWIAVAEATGVDQLRLTTRDIPDYDELMRGRLNLLDKHGLSIEDIQKVISRLHPLPGAYEFLTELRRRAEVIILSDTFYEFASPLMAQLDWPTLFCNSLEIDAEGRITHYRLRQKDGKRQAVKALKSLNFEVVAVGDSYNDAAMLGEADLGILFRPSQKVIDNFPDFRIAEDYETLEQYIDEYVNS